MKVKIFSDVSFESSVLHQERVHWPLSVSESQTGALMGISCSVICRTEANMQKKVTIK